MDYHRRYDMQPASANCFTIPKLGTRSPPLDRCATPCEHFAQNGAFRSAYLLHLGFFREKYSVEIVKMDHGQSAIKAEMGIGQERMSSA